MMDFGDIDTDRVWTGWTTNFSGSSSSSRRKGRSRARPPGSDRAAAAEPRAAETGDSRRGAAAGAPPPRRRTDRGREPFPRRRPAAACGCGSAGRDDAADGARRAGPPGHRVTATIALHAAVQDRSAIPGLQPGHCADAAGGTERAARGRALRGAMLDAAFLWTPPADGLSTCDMTSEPLVAAVPEAVAQRSAPDRSGLPPSPMRPSSSMAGATVRSLRRHDRRLSPAGFRRASARRPRG